MGGRSLEENVCGVLPKLISNNLAAQFNWKGKGWKRGFHDLKLNQVVQGMYCLLQHLGQAVP